MSLADVLPAVRALPRADRLQLAQLLIVELAQEEGTPLLQAGASYPVWSPYEAFDGAATLLRLLQQEKEP
jgi:hypothetical protein